MSSRLPVLTADQVPTILRRHGFTPVRQSESHIVLRHPDGRRATAPMHQGRDLGKGLLRQIMRDAGLGVSDLTRNWANKGLRLPPMRTEYHKLVRNRIPEIIRRDGFTCAIETMAEDEYQQALRDKLVEEAREAAVADPRDLTTELADLYEVVDALMASYGIAGEAMRAEQDRRRAERGGFEKGIRLLWTERGDQAPARTRI